MTAAAPRKRMSDRAEKATRLATASVVSAVPGLAGIITGTPWLGYTSTGIVLAAILAGPVVERIRHRGD